MFDYIPPETHPAPTVCEYIAEATPHWSVSLRSIAQKHLDTMSETELDENWKLDEFFGTIAVINLPKATDRLQKVTKELHDIGTKTFEVFEAIDGRVDVEQSIWKKFYRNLHNIDTSTPEGKLALDSLHQGQAGCYLSHYRLLQKVKTSFDLAMQELAALKDTPDTTAISQAEEKVRRYSRVLIFEDDSRFGFLDNATLAITKQGVGTSLRKALKDLPDNWDMLYLIINPIEPVNIVTPHLRKINHAWCFVAYAVNYRMYDTLVNHLSEIENPKVKKIHPVDTQTSQLHPAHNVYAVNPSVVFCNGGFSHITGKTWDPWQGQPIFKKKRKKKP